MALQSTKAVVLAVTALAGSFPGIAVASSAQPTPNADTREEMSSELGAASEIIVTARRKEESLQDVPQAVSVVTSETLQKYNLLQVSEIGKVVSGLQIQGDNISMRGITFIQISNTPTQTVTTYLNDVAVPGQQFNSAIFDLGQIEILRGPQGTLRGTASPSGAITVTTRRPSLTTLEGQAIGSVGTRRSYNIQGGVGIPIISDVLAVRLAGVIDKSEGNGVRSVHNQDRPLHRTKGARVSLRFEPSNTFSANLMYQHLLVRDASFGSAVFGRGSPGGVNPNAPKGYNGPVLTIGENRAVTDLPTINVYNTDMAVGQLEWRFLNQRLNYIGSYADIHTQTPFAAADAGNILPGYEVPGSRSDSPKKIWTHELRLSSDERVAGVFDYVVGAFFNSDKSQVFATSGIAAFLPGAFGTPLSQPYTPGPANPRYVVDTFVFLPRTYEERSFFGNVTAHVSERFEVSAGVRRIHAETLRDLSIETQPAFVAQPIPATFCAGVGGTFGATYPNVCDIPVAPVKAVIASDNLVKHNAWIYDVAASYHFSDNLMAYAHVGSSWREGGFQVGVNNGKNDPLLNSLIFGSPEKSTSYEAGLKWTFLERRGRLNVTYYHQDFKGLIYTVPGCIPYLSYTSPTATPSVQTGVCNFTVNAPAKIDGIDVDLAVDITPRWSVSGNFSWANGRITGGLLPCADANFDGVPDGQVATVQQFLNAGVVLARCKVNTGASTAPKWNLRVQSEYRMPVAHQMEAFLRGNFAYQPRNPNASQTYVVPAYGLLDVYLGLRDPSGRWELNGYAKNLTNNRTLLSVSASEISPPTGLLTVFGPTGYRSFSRVLQREFGLTLRYSFGS